MNRNLVFLKIIWIAINILIMTSPLLYAADNPYPIPQETLVVVWVRPAQLAADPQLNALLPNLGVIFNVLKTVDLPLEKIDEAVLFSPFDMSWVYGPAPGVPQKLAERGGVILKGKFDANSKYNSFKSTGWKENNYVNKKVLWWTSGEKFLCSPERGECIASLKNDKLVMGGSQDIVRAMLDVDGGKKPGLSDNPTFKAMQSQFENNNSTAVAVFAVVTDQMRSLIRMQPSDTMNTSSRATTTALNTIRSYSSHFRETGLSLTAFANGYQLGGVLSINSENSAAMLVGALQLTGGIANFLPENNPARAVLAALQISRSGNMINLQSNMSRKQFDEIFENRK